MASGGLKVHPAPVLCGLICAVLLAFFGIISLTASSRKNATVDEPLHFVAGFVHRTRADFRMDPEDPPLFSYLAVIPFTSDAMSPDYRSPHWEGMSEDPNLHQWDFAAATLYGQTGLNSDALIQRSRAVFVAVAIALGVVVATWSWQIGGKWAAVISLAFFCFDPNFIAHAAVIKNDVAVSLCILLLALAVWNFGRSGSWLWLLVIALASAAAPNIKFSGIIVLPITLLLLGIRAFLPAQRSVLGMAMQKWWQRLIVAVTVSLVAGAFTVITIWACYCFRFGPIPATDLHLNTSEILLRIKATRAANRLHTDVITSTMALSESAGILPNALSFAEQHRLLPQSWIYGLLYTYNTTFHRPSFLLGEYRDTGWWYYFPLAMLFKTPTATLAAMALLPIAHLAIVGKRLSGKENKTAAIADLAVAVGGAGDSRIRFWWGIACLALPPLTYFFVSMTSGANIGLRHILPVYPFVYIVLGVVMIRGFEQFPRIAGIACAIVFVGLLSEVLLAFPNYLAFFNFPSGGSRGGIRLLADSNLDWGQDLKALGEWQRSHMEKKLYLCYFGSAYPTFYGIQAGYLPGGWPYSNARVSVPTAGEPCYLAISATHLMGVNYPPNLRDRYRQLLGFHPLAVLGGTIYIYELPLPSPGN
jgi:hypothetical protein